ncbi:MAG TPA: alkaline phosphatase family protein [bacterium]
MAQRKQAVLVVVDGLRADMVTPRWAPNLAKLTAQSAWFAQHASVYPSTTRTASASIATGCRPSSHGLHGNAMVIDEGQGLVCLSTGKAEFRERLRKATGRTLLRPALPERLARDGHCVIVSNASPGAAFFQDPDGFGTLYNRAGSHHPGLKPMAPNEGMSVPKGVAGDAAATDRFCEDVLAKQRPALAVLWVSEPDNTGHRNPLGGPEHAKAVAGSDTCVARVIESVERHCSKDTLVLITSDHGPETTDRVIPIEQQLVDAGLKAALDSGDVLVAPQGTSALVYTSDTARSRRGAIADFLRKQDWCGELTVGEDLRALGLPSDGTLAMSVSLRKDPARVNPFGIVGYSDLMLDRMEDLNHPGCGQHGGLGENEMRPFLMAWGGRFEPGVRMDDPTSPIDIAPTLLTHLGLPTERTDGRAHRPKG